MALTCDAARPGSRATAAAGLSALALAALALGACSSLPQAGPPADTIVKGAQGRDKLDYSVVDLTPAVVARLAAAQAQRLTDVFADNRPAPVQSIGVGDVVSVTIFEAGAPSIGPTGVGAPATGIGGGQMITLPNQIVDRTGVITVPFAGQIKAAGMSPIEVQAAVVRGLTGKVIQPQAIVSVAQNQSSFVTVSGDVARPGRVPLSLTGTRLLDAIALSGGGTATASDMAVQLTRNGVTRRVRLESIIADPTQNVFTAPDDFVFLVREPQSIVVLGAVTKNAQIPFVTPAMTLAEAVGNSNGLADPQADPAGIFVFRYEPGAPGAARAPVVYRLDMKQGSGFFLAQGFPMRDKDVVYIANTKSVQLGKLVLLLRDISFIFQAKTIISN